MTAQRKITGPQQKALDWLNRQGGTGVFTKDGSAVIAKGIEAPFTRSTWIALRDARRITIGTDKRVDSLTEPTTRAIERNPSEHSRPISGGGMIDTLPGAE